jgi:hypothetical protein
MRWWIAGAALVLTLSTADAGAQPTARQFMDAHCKALTDACTGPIIQALNDAVKAGKISAKCDAGRPPKPPMGLDIALWWVGHHDYDNTPMPDAAVATAEKLWPCAKVSP